MERIGLVRSAMLPHGRHANTTGTNAPMASRPDRHAVPGPKFERTDLGQNSAVPGPKIDVRQGIA
jgi:hypothetical protein